jgi:hypothetical protein
MTVEQSIESACVEMEEWLRKLPEWPAPHPANPSGSVVAHFGPTILSEHDCIMHFARFLAGAGFAWENIHCELSPGQWMYASAQGKPPRIDLALIKRDRLLKAGFPVAPGKFPFEAACEFALGSSSWSASTARAKVEEDVEKVADYLQSGLADSGYVIVIEERDHGLAGTFAKSDATNLGVKVRLLRRWS